MNKKIVWAVVSCVLVLGLLAASCAKAEEKAPAVKEAAPAVKEAAPVIKEAAPAVKEAAPAPGAEMLKVSLTKLDGTVVEKLVEKPKYGGQLIGSQSTAVLAWDEAYQAPWTTGPTLTLTNERLLWADWTRGPAGTGEFTMYYSDFFTPKNMVGWLAESWELAGADTIIYHIRKGVRWQNKPPVNGREFTADDVIFNLKRIYFEIKTSTMYGMISHARPTEVYATDKYTVVVKAPAKTLGKTLEEMGGLTAMVPPEVVKKYGDHNQWENVLGTGPFMLVDYVPMSSATWVRNPNYWNHDPLFGKDYPTPYLDGVKLLIVPDASTRLAALRTGKVDLEYSARYSREDAEQLWKTSPDLKYLRVEPTSCWPVGFRVDKPDLPTKDIRVRRALLLGIDQQKICDTLYKGDAEIITYKVPPIKEYRANKWYTPLEELPPETRELYEYHPEKAKQLLAEAGYPDGFKTEVVVTSAYPYVIDNAEIAKAYWAKIGIDLTLDVKEFGTFMSIYQRKTMKDMLWCGRGGMPTSMYLCLTGNMYNWAMISDPKIDDYYYPEVTAVYFDVPKKDKLMREMNQYVLSQAWYYSPPYFYSYNFWQPWLKNYGGETGLGPYTGNNFLQFIWLDQELKKAMGH